MGNENQGYVNTHDYGDVKDRLMVRLVNSEMNAAGLKMVPHKEMEDLSVIYAIDMGSFTDGKVTKVIDNQMFADYGITPEQLHEDALKSSADREPFQIDTIGNVLSGLMGGEPMAVEPAAEIYVATNPGALYGAGVITQPEFMETAAETLGGDFFILPSSVHEVLMIPDDGKMTSKVLEEIVVQVNETMVSYEEKLSDHLYHYDNREKVFELAEKFDARQKARDEKELSRGEKKPSVLDKIKAERTPKEKQVSERNTRTRSAELSM